MKNIDKIIKKVEKIVNWCLIILIIIGVFGLIKQTINQESRISELENQNYTILNHTIQTHTTEIIENPFNDTVLNNSLLDLQEQMEILKQYVKELKEYNSISEIKQEEKPVIDWRSPI